MKKYETFWLDETDPAELRRRAECLRQDGLWEVARQFDERAARLDEKQRQGRALGAQGA